ncbi:acylglycerol kinase, mitochondrial isoform X1 [Scyliorhinus canicula]|uniref:acylglycerol kinase, mitochondrial isoform X1 n=1 Tax=Scyliorhinus canicula TaxID=7830 RepID=UPI0018F43C64|nr:acylglycerol kinase, mitochondrial isoform X1 [Scyliorhinus canicula]
MPFLELQIAVWNPVQRRLLSPDSFTHGPGIHVNKRELRFRTREGDAPVGFGVKSVPGFWGRDYGQGAEDRPQSLEENGGRGLRAELGSQLVEQPIPGQPLAQGSMSGSRGIWKPASTDQCKGEKSHRFSQSSCLQRTDYEGQAKKLLELMEDTDLIVVAGGDGTLQEVITGLLRREDEAVFSKIPIGFIPLGKMNSLSKVLYPSNKEQARHILNATLAIVKGETVPLDILEIKGDKDRPVFAVSGLRWGAYRDASAKLTKFWYLGPLKDKACHLLSVFQEWPPTRQTSIAYLGPTERPPEELKEKQPRPNLWQRILRRLELYWATPKEVMLMPLEPEQWEEVQESAVEVTISTLNKQADLKRTEDAMSICIEPDTISKGQFVATGSRKLTDPLLCPEGTQILQASFCKLQLPQGTEGFFSIDNEDYEAVSVDVKLLPRKLRFFCDAIKKQQMQ